MVAPAPVAETPVIESVTDHGAATGVASGSKPVIAGTGHAGDIVTLYDGGTLLGSAVVDVTVVGRSRQRARLPTAITISRRVLRATGRR